MLNNIWRNFMCTSGTLLPRVIASVCTLLGKNPCDLRDSIRGSITIRQSFKSARDDEVMTISMVIYDIVAPVNKHVDRWCNVSREIRGAQWKCNAPHLIRRERTVRRGVPLHVRRGPLGLTAVVILRLRLLDLLQKFRPWLLRLLKRVFHFLALLQGHHRLQSRNETRETSAAIAETRV